MAGRTTVVLVQPMFAPNVGSVARVMANFGLPRLVLVSPAAGLMDDPAVKHLARAGFDVFRDARVVESLEEALADVDLALGFTARTGKRRGEDLELRPAVNKVACELPDGHVAAVFGREDDGLSTEEMARCHWLVRIPTGPTFSSLNLAQAVALFAYERFESTRAPLGEPTADMVASSQDVDGFQHHLEAVLDRVGFLQEHNRDRMVLHLRKMLTRRVPTRRDVHILRGILKKVQNALGPT